MLPAIAFSGFRRCSNFVTRDPQKVPDDEVEYEHSTKRKAEPASSVMLDVPERIFANKVHGQKCIGKKI